MEKLRRMNREDFQVHLIMTLVEREIDAKKMKYIIKPIVEKGKKYNSKDDFVRLWVLPPDKICNHLYNFVEVVQQFSIMEPYYPLWINVYVKDENIVELQTSLRFRKPSELHYVETGHPPFKMM